MATWFGVLAGPIAWVIQLVGNWTLGEVIACAPASRPRGSILGLGVGAAAAIVNGVLLAITVTAGIVSLRALRSRRAPAGASAADPWTWLGVAGVITSSLFAIVIATSFVPIVLIGGCD